MEPRALKSVRAPDNLLRLPDALWGPPMEPNMGELVRKVISAPEYIIFHFAFVFVLIVLVVQNKIAFKDLFFCNTKKYLKKYSSVEHSFKNQ